MATFQSFEEIEVWQTARDFVREIYAVTGNDRFARDYGLCSQIRRAAVSIISNVAEGFERNGSGEFVQFLSIAKGSTGEVRAQLYVALDQKYIDEATFERLSRTSGEISRQIGGFMNYLRRSKIRGTKYK